ncbi:membrane protein, partial [Achromatium sp. WMS1]
DIDGNKDFPTDKLKEGLKDIGLAEGRVFNRSVLDKIGQELRRQYFSRGKYAVTVDIKVTPLERNRVAVQLQISEGVTARIRQITIIGNKAFSEDDLLDLFELGTSSWTSYFTSSDKYSKQKLAGDLEKLRSYYLDRGYINFKIESTQVSISPNKKDIFVTIVVKEGTVHKISDIKLAGNLVVPPQILFPSIRLSRGDVFSRKKISASIKRIGEVLGDRGYAFAKVNSIPKINKKNKQVALTFFIDPGKRVYVRRINIKGNTRTRDEVIRRELRQMESAWFSSSLLQRSNARLKRLGFFEDVQIETPPVSGSADEVDINIDVKEKGSGLLAATIGYSQTDGVVFSTSITQHNFLGTGKRMSFGFNNSSSRTMYRLSYTNPYYTIDGISRGFDLSYSKTDYSELNILSYATDTKQVGVNFGLPISDIARVGLDLSYIGTDLRAGDADVAQAFVEQNGSQFNDYRVTLSWLQDTRDSALLPKNGTLQQVIFSASAPLSDLQFYRINYKHDQYFPLWGDLILNFNENFGYGNGFGNTSGLPFFHNFFAGGPRSVRGFKQNTLGPRNENNDPMGGNLEIVGSLELILPSIFSEEFAKTARLTTFFDIGNVWQISGDNASGFNPQDLRYSVGVGASWLSPIGALSVSLGYPLNSKDGDRVENFQFNLGHTF